MAKPILYYALVRGRYSWTRGFHLLGVTSEKGRQVYGRDEHDAVTHVSDRDIIHRWPPGTPLEFCKAAPARADAEAKRHEIGIRMARAEVSRLEEVQQNAVLAAAKGELTPTDKTPTLGPNDGALPPEPAKTNGKCVRIMAGIGCRCTDPERVGCDNWRNQDLSARFVP